VGRLRDRILGKRNSDLSNKPLSDQLRIAWREINGVHYCANCNTRAPSPTATSCSGCGQTNIVNVIQG
jgi:ribosomal protein L40E